MSNTFNIELGKELKTIRIQHNMSQQYVADRLNKTRACIGNYEQGTRSVDIDTLFKLCDIYNVDINDVVNEVRKYVYKK